MRRFVWLFAGGAVLAAGCASPDGRGRVAAGRESFDAMQAAVQAAAETARDTVVLVKLKGVKSSDNSRVIMFGGQGQSASGAVDKNINGLILTPNGYAIVAQTLKPDEVPRIEAWVGDIEYRARVVKSDDQLGMAVIKIETDEPLKAINIEQTGDLRVGDWCVGVQPSDEAYDYEQFSSLALCRGLVDGRYRTFLLDNAGGMQEGTPVMDLSGKVAGIVNRRGQAIAMSDLREDLMILLDDAQGVKSAAEEAKQNAWFGAMLKTINKEYARKHGLDNSSIWVQFVIPDGPAERAGILAGDLLTRVNDRQLRFTGDRAHQFFMKSLRPRVGEPFRVTVLRDGKTVECAGRFDKKPEDQTLRADDLGVTVKAIEPGSDFSANLFSTNGVYVTEIKKGSAAAVGSNMRSSLLSRGDIITAVGGTATPDLATFSAEIEKLRRERPDVVLVSYLRGRVTGFAALNLSIGERDANRENGAP